MLAVNSPTSQSKTRARCVYGQYHAHLCPETNKTTHSIFPPETPVGRYSRQSYSHIRTIVTHENTQTLLAIPFDLDADKALEHWKNEDGSLNHNLIVNRLRHVMPELEAVPFKVVRSRSGLGLGLLFMINPLNITKVDGSRNEDTQGLYQRFTQIQGLLSHIMEREGMGADPAAKGLNRYVPNWRNKEALLLEEQSKEKLNRRTRLNIQKAITKALKRYEDYERLYKDERCENKLIPLFQELYEATLNGASYITKHASEFIEEYGLSAPTVRKILIAGKGTPWLKAERTSGDNYKLLLKGDYLDWQVWHNRCHDLQKQDEIKASIGAPYNSKPNLQVLCQPKNVADGDRNHWLWSVAILIASEIDGVWTGSGEKKVYKPSSEAHAFFQNIAIEIPDATTSRNCTEKSLKKILNWAYAKAPEYSRRERNYPEWFISKINSYRSNTVAEDLEECSPSSPGTLKTDTEPVKNPRVSSLWRFRVGAHCHALYSFDGENYNLQALIRDARSFMQPWLKTLLKKQFDTDDVLKLPPYALGAEEIKEISEVLGSYGVKELKHLPKNYLIFLEKAGGQGKQSENDDNHQNFIEDEIVQQEEKETMSFNGEEEDIIIIPPENFSSENVVTGTDENISAEIFNVFKPHIDRFKEVQVCFNIGREINQYDRSKLQNAISCGLTPWALGKFVKTKELHFKEKGFKFYGSLEKMLSQMKDYEVFGDFVKEDRELFWNSYLSYLPVMQLVHEKLDRYGSAQDAEFFLNWIKITKGNSDFMMALVKQALQQFDVKGIAVLNEKMLEIKAKG